MDWDWNKIVTAFIPSLVTSGASMLSSAGTAASTDRQLQDKMQFEAQQNALERQGQMDRLMAQIAAQKATAGAGSAAQMAAVKQRAYEAAINAFLAGGDNQHGAAELLIRGMQQPHMGR